MKYVTSLTMKQFFGFLAISVFVLVACGQDTSDKTKDIKEISVVKTPQRSFINEAGKTISSRFLLPENYERVSFSEASFGQYLRNLPLKKHGAQVSYFDGRSKPNYQVYDAVVDLAIGKRDLHQCADAVMRLYAEYHFEQKEYDKIHFNFTNGFRVDYNVWRKG